MLSKLASLYSESDLNDEKKFSLLTELISAKKNPFEEEEEDFDDLDDEELDDEDFDDDDFDDEDFDDDDFDDEDFDDDDEDFEDEEDSLKLLAA